MASTNELMALLGQTGSAFAQVGSLFPTYGNAQNFQSIIEANQGLIAAAAQAEQRRKQKEQERKNKWKRIGKGALSGGIKGAIVGGPWGAVAGAGLGAAGGADKSGTVDFGSELLNLGLTEKFGKQLKSRFGKKAGGMPVLGEDEALSDEEKRKRALSMWSGF